MNAPAPPRCSRCGGGAVRRWLGGLCRRCVTEVSITRDAEADVAADADAPHVQTRIGPGLDLEAEIAAIGRYRLSGKLGEGGCGVVYAADQAAPVRRRVAIKLLKPGLDTKAIVARFEGERQALARMDHPSIARVFEAGSTPAGRPFFAMELVSGVRITEYCDRHRLSLRARLMLFVEVCLAVQHAHQKGVIHRDLKPSNILVAEPDDPERPPCPKVIDFGIAKAIEEPLSDATCVTDHHQILGTPAYMSPEQAGLGGQDIDARSDLYSLGVLLHELLTGRTPFDPGDGQRVDPDLMRRRIRELEPSRPSVRLGQLPAPELLHAAGNRGLRADELRARLRGDLDWIVMKCLEKDRERRYPTANALAQDLRRHLADEPVSAAAPGAGYRFGKFARRNRLTLAVAALVVVVLLLATLTSLTLAIRATRAEALARKRLLDSEAIARFLTDLFQSPDPRRDGRLVTVAENLDRAAGALATNLLDQPDRRALLQASLAGTYQALGLYRDAVALRRLVRDYYLDALGPGHPDTHQAMQALAQALDAAGDTEMSLSVRTEAVRIRGRTEGERAIETLRAKRALATSLRNSGRLEQSRDLGREVLTSCREILGPEHPDTLEALYELASSPGTEERERLVLWGEYLVLSQRAHRVAPARIHEALQGRAIAAERLGDLDEALALCRRLLASLTQSSGPEHPDTRDAERTLLRQLLFRGRLDEAEPLLLANLARARAGGPQTHAELTGWLGELADVRRRQRRFEAAEGAFREALEIARAPDGGPADGDSVSAITLRARLGGMLAEWAWADRTGDPVLALERAREGEALARGAFDRAADDSRFTTKRLATVRSLLGSAISVGVFLEGPTNATRRLQRLAEAEVHLRDGLRDLEAVRDDQVGNYFSAMDRLDRFFQVEGRSDDARALLVRRKAYENWRAGWE